MLWVQIMTTSSVNLFLYNIYCRYLSTTKSLNQPIEVLVIWSASQVIGPQQLDREVLELTLARCKDQKIRNCSIYLTAKGSLVTFVPTVGYVVAL